MAKPILRVSKIKKTGRSTPESVHGEHSRSAKPKNADPAKLRLNRWMLRPDKDLRSAIREKIEAAGIDYDQTRSDAVIANDMLLTVSPDFFRPSTPDAHGTWEEGRLAAFRKAVKEFIAENVENVVSAVLHLDEATPHVQLVTVPLVASDGATRLSAKEAFGPERLQSLQEAWQAKLLALNMGVEPRTVGSTARHTTLKEYYSSVASAKATEPKMPRLTDPPTRGRVEGNDAYEGRVREWKKDEQKRLREALKPFVKEAAKGRLYEAERLSGVEVRARLENHHQRLVEAHVELDLTKAQIDALRRSNVTEVAVAIGYLGTIGPRENAIDLLKRVEGLNYRQAVAWLHQRFGGDVVAAEATAYATSKAQDEPKVIIPSEAKKRQVIEQQLSAIDAPAYRVTVMKLNAEGKKIGINLGKIDEKSDIHVRNSAEKSESETLFSKDQIKEMIPDLVEHNARGGNIFITPIDPKIHHVLVDDLTPDTLAELRARGYDPALVQETSPNSIQAVLKLPVTDKVATNEWFKDLNRTFGDDQITGLVHPIRLAGFHNQKPKHATADNGRPPFVRIIHAVNTICAKSVAVVRAYVARNASPDDVKPPKGWKP